MCPSLESKKLSGLTVESRTIRSCDRGYRERRTVSMNSSERLVSLLDGEDHFGDVEFGECFG